MSKETMLLIIAWILTSVLLIVFTPKNKIRHAWVIFLFKQLITWMFGLMVVEYRLIEYPVRIFKYATRTSFTFEYFVYPALCVIFNLHYPAKKGFFGQFMHYVYFCTAISGIEILFEKYTNLIKYIHWSWYLTWITLFITFYMSRKFYIWFYKIEVNN